MSRPPRAGRPNPTPEVASVMDEDLKSSTRSNVNIIETEITTPTTDYNPAPHHRHRVFTTNGDLFVFVMVGLPARGIFWLTNSGTGFEPGRQRKGRIGDPNDENTVGKTYVAHKIKHYFEFFHSAPTAVFNAGQTRRRLLGAKHSHNFFDPKNEKGVQLREDMAKRVEGWVVGSGEC
eukprot:1361247-Amorphochlora_amoeboformis.AAC.1